LASTTIQIVGSKKTGKTSLLEDVTRKLTRRGRTVIYLKHRHEDARLDAADTDTSRLMEAGARVAALVGDTSTVVFRSADDEQPERIAARESSPGDIILAEGWKNQKGPKIVVPGGDLDLDALDGIIAVVGEPAPGIKAPAIPRDDVDAVCDLVEKTAGAGGGDAWRTSLVIDGRVVALNAFVQDVFASAVAGMTLALQGVEGGDTLELRCVRKRPTEDR